MDHLILFEWRRGKCCEQRVSAGVSAARGQHKLYHEGETPVNMEDDTIKQPVGLHFCGVLAV